MAVVGLSKTSSDLGVRIFTPLAVWETSDDVFVGFKELGIGAFSTFSGGFKESGTGAFSTFSRGFKSALTGTFTAFSAVELAKFRDPATGIFSAFWLFSITGDGDLPGLLKSKDPARGIFGVFGSVGNWVTGTEVSSAFSVIFGWESAALFVLSLPPTSSPTWVGGSAGFASVVLSALTTL